MKQEQDLKEAENSILKTELEASQKSSDLHSDEIKTLTNQLQQEQSLRMQSEQELEQLKQTTPQSGQPPIETTTALPGKGELAAIQQQTQVPDMQDRYPAIPAPPTHLIGQASSGPAKTGTDGEHKDDPETGSIKDNKDEEEDPDLKTGKTKTDEDKEKGGDEVMSPKDGEKEEEVEDKKPEEQVQKPLEEPAPVVPAMFKSPQVAAAKATKPPNPPPPPPRASAATPKSSAAKRTGISEQCFFIFLIGWWRKCDKYKKLWIWVSNYSSRIGAQYINGIYLVYTNGYSIYQVYTWYILPGASIYCSGSSIYCLNWPKTLSFFDFFREFDFFSIFLPKKRTITYFWGHS